MSRGTYQFPVLSIVCETIKKWAKIFILHSSLAIDFLMEICYDEYAA